MSYLDVILARYESSVATPKPDLIDQVGTVQTLLQSILTPYPKIDELFKNEVATSHQTKYHAENLQEHLIACGLICSHMARDFYRAMPILATICTEDVFVEMCLRTGLYHDIGKPFARNDIKKRSIYIGHAQLGARFLEETSSCNEAMIWAVDHHMCYCCHRHIGDFSKTHYAIDSLMFDVKPEQHVLCFALLSCLAFADLFAREDTTFDYDYATTFKYSIDLFAKLCERFNTKQPIINYQKYILHMYGLSGSGKSHVSKLCKTMLQDNHSNSYGTSGKDNSYPDKALDVQPLRDKFTIHVVSRDECLENVYYDLIKSDPSILADSNTKYSYRQMYDYVYAQQNGKEKVQQEWVRRLSHACTLESNNTQLIIIDTCQTMYPSAWSATIDSMDEDARAEYATAMKLGYLAIPWHYFNHEYAKKMPEYSVLPITDRAFWPHSAAETETMETGSMHWMTGSVNQLMTFMNNVGSNDSSQTINCDIQQSMLHDLLNKLHTIGSNNFDHTCQQLNQFLGVDFINYRVEIENDQCALITFTYCDGLQQFNLATRDYRGEGVLFDKQQCQFMMLRPALPVFAEMASIHHDHRALSYLVPNFGQIFGPDHYIHRMRHTIPHKTVHKYVITPKYDGSLFNLTFISCQHPTFNLMMKLINDNLCNSDETSGNQNTFLPSAYHVTQDGLFLIGSKGTCLSKNPVNARIRRSIAGSYKEKNQTDAIENFIADATQCINHLITESNQIITLHFEAIDVTPTDELTVIYDRSMCVFFGVTVFDMINNEKKYLLPNQVMQVFKDVSTVQECDTFEQVTELYNRNYNLMFDEHGSTIVEPEGFVLHLIVPSGRTLSIKYKFDLYYVAHKPTAIKNVAKAQMILSDYRYTHIRKRLLKFATRCTVSEILNSINFEQQVHVLHHYDKSMIHIV